MRRFSDLANARAALGALAASALLGACATSGPATDRPDAASAGADETVPVAAQASFAAALAAMRAEHWAEAEVELEQLVLAYPGYAGPHVNLAIVYMRDGRDAEARAALEAALELDPAQPAANNQLGILLRRAGEFAAAEQGYRRALESDPDYALAHLNLGVLLDLYLQRGREALEHYERYQTLVAEPSRRVAGWIIDLRRRLDVDEAADAARVAREDGS